MKSKFHLVLGMAIGFVLPLTVLTQQYESGDRVCGGKSLVRTDLFFGLSKPDRSEVSSAEFQQFIDRDVTPLFPDGLTITAAKGQYRDSQGKLVRERSQLMTLLYPINAENSKKVDQIREAYKQAFRQESVLRVDERSCASF